VTIPQPRHSSSLPSFLRFLSREVEQNGLDPLAKQGPDLDPEAIADLIWLAVNQPAIALAAKRRSADDDSKPDQPKKRSSERNQTERAEPAVVTPSPSIGPSNLVTNVREPGKAPRELEAQLLPEASVPGSERLPVWVRDPFELLNPQQLFEAMLPVMQEVPGDRPACLDEAATLDHYARWRQLIPVWQPDQHYRFELTLIVDQGFAMRLWQPLLDNLERRLNGFHGFQGIRVLPWAGGGEAGGGKAGWEKVANLIEGQGRSCEGLVALISDCAGPKWRGKGGIGPGPAFSLLLRLGASRPVVVWQVLPDWMWSRTALGQGEPVALRRTSEGNAWPYQLARPLETRWHGKADVPPSVPVFHLTIEGLRAWGRLFGGSPFIATSGILLPLSPFSLPGAAQTEQPPGDGTKAAEEEEKENENEDALMPLRRFQHLASNDAKQLLALFAAAPVLTLPVMRLIQAAMLEGAGAAAMSEALLSGLLRPIARNNSIDPELLQLTFTAPIRAALLRQQSPGKTLEVIEAVTDFIALHWSQQGWGSFRAFLTDPTIAAPFQQEQTQYFAMLAADIIAQLGGEYTTFAERLRGAQRKDPFPRNLFSFEELEEETAQIARFPELEQFTITTANLHSVQLRAFEFETATIQGTNITKKRGSTRGYREPLESGVAEASGHGSPGGQLAPAANLEMLHIPAGRFTMGSPPDESERHKDEGPQHEVELRDFFLSRTPISQAQWLVVAGWQPLPGEEPWLRELHPDPVSKLNDAEPFLGHKRPVVTVSWEEAMEFCRRLSLRTGKHYTLPSEAQWEYACRAKTITPFHFGETISPELANYNGNYTYGDGQKGGYREQTTDAGSFPANAWGLHDMHGNVWEWCADHWHESYDLGQQKAPGDGSPWLDGDGNEGEKAIKFVDDTDVLYNGTTYKNWRITVTPTSLGYMYETAAPGQEFTGMLPGLPHESIDECLRIAKKSIDNALKQSDGATGASDHGRVLRGGSWIIIPGYCRSAYRGSNHPDGQHSDVGFRVCCLPQDLLLYT
jgi:formylglycine-generating enzyme required for sulfatase activity